MKIMVGFVLAINRKSITLEEVLSAGERGIIYPEHLRGWENFKRDWSKEDKIMWANLLKRFSRDSNGKYNLEPPLTDKEMIWSKKLIKMAAKKGLC
jgi:hypothetical protein